MCKAFYFLRKDSKSGYRHAWTQASAPAPCLSTIRSMPRFHSAFSASKSWVKLQGAAALSASPLRAKVSFSRERYFCKIDGPEERDHRFTVSCSLYANPPAAWNQSRSASGLSICLPA
jgi:hypothetical protein